MTHREWWRWASGPGSALAMLAAVLLSGACAGDGDRTEGREEGTAAPAEASESYPEGEVAIAVEMLDTGLLKGNARAEAAKGWRVTAISVEATAPGDTGWGVLEFPQGIGSASAA